MHEFIEHTADVRLRVQARSMEELFRESMLGMFEILESGGAPPPPAECAAEGGGAPLTIHSTDRTSLLVDFLNEVLSRVHIQRACFGDVAFTVLTETDLAATLTGRRPARFGHDVKAVTYHEADVRYANGMWSTMLVFDI